MPGLDIAHSKELPDDKQQTKERKPYALKKNVTDNTGCACILCKGIEQQFEKAMETVSKFFREEKDFLYREG